jgi:hypothetical protein
LSYKLKPVKRMHYNKHWLNYGTKVELEHTTDRRLARKIAQHHLSESKSYYQELRKLERKLGID